MNSERARSRAWSIGGGPAAVLLASMVGFGTGRDAGIAGEVTIRRTTTVQVVANVAPRAVPPVLVPDPTPVPERGPSPEPAPAPAPRPVVVLYGDSLAWESRDFFAWTLASRPELTVVSRTFGGTAICDFLDHMRDDAAALAPGVVVVEFSGNASTPCMTDGSGQFLTGQPYLDRYESDARAVLDIFLPIGATVIFAGAPDSGVPAIDAHTVPIRQLYQRVAGEHSGVEYVDAGAAVLDGGRWTAALPCLTGEPCSGGTDANGTPVNIVRAPDQLHFCPTGGEAQKGVTGDCSVWSSGAFRFGTAMAAPVLERYGS